VSTTILVLSVDEAERLEAALPAAVAQPGAEVVVIDNACADATGEVAQRHGARVVRLETRLPYAAAMNAGLRATGGDAVLLLNADCVLDPCFLAFARPQLDEAEVGSVAPLLLRATGLAPADRLDEVDAAGMTLDRRRKNGLAGHGEPAAPWRAAGGEAFGPDGACALYRREVLDAVGPEVFDEDLALWATDADIAWRARALGWRCAFEPRAFAWHVRFYSPTTRPSVPAEHRRLQFRNRLLMILKNDRPWPFLRDLPLIAAWELVSLGHVLLRERHLLGAYREAWALRRAMRAKRRRDAAAHVPFGLRPRG